VRVAKREKELRYHRRFGEIRLTSTQAIQKGVLGFIVKSEKVAFATMPIAGRWKDIMFDHVLKSSFVA
jgi:hypothetical protein